MFNSFWCPKGEFYPFADHYSPTDLCSIKAEKAPPFFKHLLPKFTKRKNNLISIKKTSNKHLQATTLCRTFSFPAPPYCIDYVKSTCLWPQDVQVVSVKLCVPKHIIFVLYYCVLQSYKKIAIRILQDLFLWENGILYTFLEDFFTSCFLTKRNTVFAMNLTEKVWMFEQMS